MSVHYSSPAWQYRVPEMSIKLVLVKLADNANDQGVCWPSLAQICAETCMSKSTVCEKITWLISNGILERQPGYPGRSTIYKLNKQKLIDGAIRLSASRTVRQPDSPLNGLGLSASRTEVVRQPDRGSPPAGHQPSLNHQGTVNEPPSDLLAQSQGGESGSGASPDANGSTSSHPDQTAVSAEKKEGGRRPRDLCFEALVEIQGSRLKEISRSERGQINRALRDIREVAPQLTPEELKKRTGVYRDMMPGMTLTAGVLASWWSRLGSNGSGAPVHDAQPVVAVPETEPEGWREAAKDLYGADTRTLWSTWAAVPSSNKTDISKALKKKKGGGNV